MSLLQVICSFMQLGHWVDIQSIMCTFAPKFHKIPIYQKTKNVSFLFHANVPKTWFSIQLYILSGKEGIYRRQSQV